MATPILDAVQAILADGSLTLAEQRRRIRLARAIGMRNALLDDGAFPKAWTFTTQGGAVSWGLTVVDMDLDGAVLSLVLTLTRNRKPIALKNPFRIVNAPRQTIVAGVRTYDPVGAIKQVLIDAVRAS